MAGGRLAKDVHYLQRHIHAQTEGQAKVVDVDDNLEFLMLNVLPNDGFYKGAKLRFKLTFSDCYPEEVPRVRCLDNVYHPNIDPSLEDEEDCSNVCVSLLDEWDSEMGLDHVVMAILFLMYHPNPEDALSPYFDECLDMDTLEENIRATLGGGEFEDKSWPCLLAGDEQEEETASANDGSEIPAATDEQSLASSESTNVGNATEKLTDERSAFSAETVSVPLSESGNPVICSESGSSVDQGLSPSSTVSFTSDSFTKMSLTDTEILNHHNLALTLVTDTFAQSKGSPLISLDEIECERKASDSGQYSDSLGIARLFCTNCRASRIKALFSCFCGRDATAQLPVTNMGVPADSADCDVD